MMFKSISAGVITDTALLKNGHLPHSGAHDGSSPAGMWPLIRIAAHYLPTHLSKSGCASYPSLTQLSFGTLRRVAVEYPSFPLLRALIDVEEQQTAAVTTALPAAPPTPLAIVVDVEINRRERSKSHPKAISTWSTWKAQCSIKLVWALIQKYGYGHFILGIRICYTSSGHKLCKPCEVRKSVFIDDFEPSGCLTLALEDGVVSVMALTKWTLRLLLFDQHVWESILNQRFLDLFSLDCWKITPVGYWCIPSYVMNERFISEASLGGVVSWCFYRLSSLFW